MHKAISGKEVLTAWTRAWWVSAALAVRDLRYDWKVSLVLVLSVASVLAPLLLLLGLKTGVVSTMRDQLLDDPRNLEILIFENAQLDRAWFQAASARGDLRFVIPKTRTISATADLVGPGRRVATGVELVPTGEGDPLIPRGMLTPSRQEQVLLSRSLAAKLRAGSTDAATLIVRRRLDDHDQVAEVVLQVVGVLPESAYVRDAAFLPLEMLVAVEDYRDGFAVPPLGITEGRLRGQPRSLFANARVYAEDLDGVLAIADWMRNSGLEVRTRAKEIENVRATDRVLSYIFGVIAVIAVVGCGLSLGGSLWINADRKRHDLALLRLLGFVAHSVLIVPVVQALFIAAAAFGIAYGAYGVGAFLFNQVLGSNLAATEFVCRLFWKDIVVAGCLTVLVALTASAAGGLRASRVGPADCLREL